MAIGNSCAALYLSEPTIVYCRPIGPTIQIQTRTNMALLESESEKPLENLVQSKRYRPSRSRIGSKKSGFTP